MNTDGLSGLPDRALAAQQLCLKLYQFSGLSDSEIAVLTGLAPSQGRSELRR